MADMIDFSSRIVVPETVLYRQVDEATVLLNLQTESYLSLDEVGSRMWALFTTEPSLEAAYEKLLAEYAVEPDVLRRDIENLVNQMLEHGLVELKSA